MIEAELPDGTVLEFPDGTPQSVIQASVRKTMGVKAPSQPDAFDQKLRESAKINPVLEAGANVLGGATGLMRGTANIVGGVFGNSKLGQDIWPTTALDKSSIAYTVGELLDPVSMGVSGAAFKAAGALPQVAKLTKLKPIVQGMIGGGVAGGATGALSENGDAGTGAVVGALLGGAIPGVVMGAQKLRKIAEPITKAGAQTHAGRMVKEVAGETYDDVLNALKNLNTPFSKPSVAQATAKLNNPEIAALQRVAEGISPVPGVTREAAQRGERAGLLQSFAGTDDEIKRMVDARSTTSATNAVKVGENAANLRIGRETSVMPPVYEWVDDLGMLHRGLEKPSIGAASSLGSTTRTATTPVKDALGIPIKPSVIGTNAAGMPVYSTPGVNVNKVSTQTGGNSSARITKVPSEIPSVPALESLKANPGFNAAVADARRMAANAKNIPDSDLTAAEIADILKDPTKSFKGLRLMKAAIDDRFANPTNADTALSKIDDRSLTNLKNAFVGASEQAAPGWSAARNEFADQSNEIFQKKVGQNMLGLLQKPLGEGESGAKLARAVEAETSLVKKSGGFGREGLDEQLTPENLAKVGKVISQLDADTAISELSRKGMRSAAIRDAVGTGIELPNLMNQGVAIANGLIRRVFGAGQTKTLRELAEVMQDPALTAKLMERATAKEKNAIEFMRKTMQYYSPYAAAQAGSME